jgi:hypothetical protein
MSTAFGVATPIGHRSPLRMLRFDRFMAQVPSQRAADMMGVKTLLTWGTLAGDLASAFHEVYSDDMVHIYENSQVLPRAYLAHQAEVLPNSSAALRRLGESDFNPWRTAVVEEPLELPPSDHNISAAAIRSYSPLQVVIDTDSQQNTLLVLTDSYYPGWRAYVDGKETPILHANYLFRGVALPSGKHTVEFVYFADSFKIGLALSGITAGLLITVLIVGLRRKKLGNNHGSYH